MTFPAASFTAIAPPPDGLSLAFTSARRRRNSKAAVSAFGGVVAIVSALSFVAPPGQSLVQEPAQPARSGLLTELTELPRHGAPAPIVRTPVTHAPAVVSATSSAQLGRPAPVVPIRRSSSVVTPGSCATTRALACAIVRTPAPGGPTMRARVCPAAVTLTVEYDAPPIGPTRSTSSQTVQVGSCPA